MNPHIEMTPSIVIENMTPQIDGGLFPIKRVVGDLIEVEADIYKEGHEVLRAALLYREKNTPIWTENHMVYIKNDRWQASFQVNRNTRYLYTIKSWVDPLMTWARDMQKRCEVSSNCANDIEEGIILLESIKCPQGDVYIQKLKKSKGTAKKILSVIGEEKFQELLTNSYLQKQLYTSPHELEVVVDRERAIYSAWYEFFPRSQGVVEGKSATFKDCEKRLPEIKKLGFNVIYLPPIHPIGITNRKGRNNSLKAGPESPGSPWAIGNDLGGHKSVHPDLGSLEDFEHFVKKAHQVGIEIALDFAIQCSPDHPYVKEHPEWFYHLADGSIKYAENTPKKYEDIYPLNFYCEQTMPLWLELKSIVEFWIEKGVKIFRVDNPHTKHLHFWKWFIREIQELNPEVIFLSEAFTRPKIMKYLAKSGFTQSYTYFTWRNYKAEIKEYLEELTQSPMKEYIRGNFFTNTPDILTEYLQNGGPPAFKIRLALAATLSSNYGIYSSYELCEAKAKEEGSEEYLDSEKYQYKTWDWNRAGNIKSYISRINFIRSEHQALHRNDSLRFHPCNNENIICYSKQTPDKSDVIIAVVNLDPFHVQDDLITLPIWEFGIDHGQTYQMRELISGDKFNWKGATNYIRLDPDVEPAHIFFLKK